MIRSFLQRHTLVRWVLYTIAVLCVSYIVLCLTLKPSNDRHWELGQEAMPTIAIDDHHTITITNFRDFDWRKVTTTTPPHYETRTYNLDSLERVDVLISHFAEFEGLAHIFLSFGFTNGDHVVVSVETRREIGEKFSPLLGLLRQFEIIYVVGSEKDIIGVRTDVRENERVYLYPTTATPDDAKKLFLAIANDINDLAKTPRMYNTLTHNCTNEITRRVEDISTVKFPFTWKTVLPGYFDEVLYTMGLIQSDKPFDVVKKQHLINNKIVNRYNVTYSADLRDQVSRQ